MWQHWTLGIILYKFKSAHQIRKRYCDVIKKHPDPAARCSMLNMVCVCVCGQFVRRRCGRRSGSSSTGFRGRLSTSDGFTRVSTSHSASLTSPKTSAARRSTWAWFSGYERDSSHLPANHVSCLSQLTCHCFHRYVEGVSYILDAFR